MRARVRGGTAGACVGGCGWRVREGVTRVRGEVGGVCMGAWLARAWEEVVRAWGRWRVRSVGSRAVCVWRVREGVACACVAWAAAQCAAGRCICCGCAAPSGGLSREVRLRVSPALSAMVWGLESQAARVRKALGRVPGRWG